jgi:tRNA nucleotidyltransferase (CCA-adding enzyme)
MLFLINIRTDVDTIYHKQYISNNIKEKEKDKLEIQMFTHSLNHIFWKLY